MTKFLNNKIVLFLLPLALSAVIGLTANAQTGNCTVTGAMLRVTRPFNFSTFYNASNPPYVYIDIETANCSPGDTIKVSLTEVDAFVDDDISGGLGSGDACDGLYNQCMRERVVQVPAPQFTLALKAGEDECEGGAPDCRYFLRTWDELSTDAHEWFTGLRLEDGSVQNAGATSSLNYNCDTTCSSDHWFYLGPLSIYQGSHANDPDGGPAGGIPTPPGGGIPTPGGGGIPTPGGTATSAEGPTVIDLNLTNPLAGTIDTLPMLFQKIVYIIIKIAIPLIAIAIIYSGLLFVTARGNEEQLKKAKNALTFAIIGGLVLLASWLVANAIRDALTTLSD